jgi:hypothetical protein
MSCCICGYSVARSYTTPCGLRVSEFTLDDEVPQVFSYIFRDLRVCIGEECMKEYKKNTDDFIQSVQNTHWLLRKINGKKY